MFQEYSLPPLWLWDFQTWCKQQWPRLTTLVEDVNVNNTLEISTWQLARQLAILYSALWSVISTNHTISPTVCTGVVTNILHELHSVNGSWSNVLQKQNFLPPISSHMKHSSQSQFKISIHLFQLVANFTFYSSVVGDMLLGWDSMYS